MAILAAPADQASPVTPFDVDKDIPDYQAVRTVEGTPAANGLWRFTVYARPTKTTSFRVTVTDMNDPSLPPDQPARKTASRLVDVEVREKMTVAIEQPEYVVTAGQSVQLRASVAGGITPYKIHLEADDGSQATTLSATNILIPLAKPASTTVYTIPGAGFDSRLAQPGGLRQHQGHRPALLRHPVGQPGAHGNREHRREQQR